jgi:predicted O-linked N-acetylglucosamine transferase (SPINDLY family)
MNVGNALRHMGLLDDATGTMRIAVAINPGSAPARFNLGSLLASQGKHSEAIDELAEALRLQPTMIEALLVLADVFERENRLDDAESCFHRALDHHPNHPATLVNYGMYCSRARKFDLALSLFARVKSIEPHFRGLESAMLFSLNFRTDVDVLTIASVHRRVGAQIQREVKPPYMHSRVDLRSDRRLRIGYVSGDFTMHPVAVFLRPILEHHDRTRFHVFCYSNYPGVDPVASFLRERCDEWRSVAELGDDDVCELIQRDRIDILVDLSGHTARNRLTVFARRPAPVQVTWLGYLNTTGLSTVDYRICDWHTDPVEYAHLNSEKLVRMPASQWCYMPWHETEPITNPHAERPNAIVFGSFNQVRKISDECLMAWAHILARVPAAELLVLDVTLPDTRREFSSRTQRAGIDQKRIVVKDRQSIAGYFNTIGNVDIALDTFPYGGATTTLDTLWMGTPIVCLRGNRTASRGGYSLLMSLGADELIAADEQQYVDLNVRLATDRPWRLRLRKSLRTRLKDSPLMDASGFTEALESRYMEMWRAFSQRGV